MKLIPAILALLLLAVPSQAKVLVYKGTRKLTTDTPPSLTLPTVLNAYIIVDPDTNKYSQILYYTKNGKHQVPLGATPVHFTSAPALAGKTKTAITNGSATFTDATHFSEFLFLIVGTNATLQFTTMGSVQTTNFPKTFTGSQSLVENGGGTGSIGQSQFVLSLQSKATLAANDGGKTIDMVTNQISMDLQNKGYLP